MTMIQYCQESIFIFDIVRCLDKKKKHENILYASSGKNEKVYFLTSKISSYGNFPCTDKRA
jgi:hypothetical protein